MSKEFKPEGFIALTKNREDVFGGIASVSLGNKKEIIEEFENGINVDRYLTFLLNEYMKTNPDVDIESEEFKEYIIKDFLNRYYNWI